MLITGGRLVGGDCRIARLERDQVEPVNVNEVWVRLVNVCELQSEALTVDNIERTAIGTSGCVDCCTMPVPSDCYIDCCSERYIDGHTLHLPR